MFRKKSVRGDQDTEYQCTVRFLDDAESMQLSYKKEYLGQWLLDQVCEKLNIVEKDYFGLRYVDTEKQRHWIDPLKTVYKQIKAINPQVLCFRVKFYPADPMKLHEEITRYQLFLQLRRDLHHGRLLCSQNDANLLAAYVIQSEVGDYDPIDCPQGYVSKFNLLPKQSAKMEEEIIKLHQTMTGQVPAESEANFLRKAATLDTYGVDPHQVKDQKGNPLYLGATHQGIMTFQGSRRTQLYKWNQIRRLSLEGKMFIVHVNIAEPSRSRKPKRSGNPKKDEDTPNTKKKIGSRRKQQPIGFKTLTVPSCKYLWKCAVEQQMFFTLTSSINTPKVKSGGTLFSRGSKFRFSGRCQNEAINASENIKRQEPEFNRTSSLPNFTRRKHTGPNTLDTSIISDTVPDEPPKILITEVTRIYQESPVDVPVDMREKTEPDVIHEGPIMKAPPNMSTYQAPEVNEKLISQTIGNYESRVPDIQIIPVDDVPSTPPYEPNQTIIDEEEEDRKSPRKSLDEQLKDLEDQFDKLPADQNHIDADRVEPSTQKVVNTSQKSHSKLGSCCKLLVYSFLVTLLILSITIFVLYYLDVQHPYLTEMKKQLHFIEPARDYINEKVKTVFKS